MRLRLLFLASIMFGAAAPAAPPRDNLDAAARDYVRLQLAIGEKEDGYIDAYYGPENLRAEARKPRLMPTWRRFGGAPSCSARRSNVWGHVAPASALAEPASSPRN